MSSKDDSSSTLDAQTASLRSWGLSDGQTSTPALAGLDPRGYELVEQLGAGGMGEVYRAADPALGRDLAVKVMKSDYSRNVEAESRFLREAHITGALQHPGIVPVHNLGRLADGRLHYTMRLVRGQTLSAILKEDAGKPERLATLLPIFEKVCQAVAYAHSKRILHRDLKPSNIMVGRFGEVQVMDWGLAKQLDFDKSAAAAEGAPGQISTLGRLPSPDTPWDLSQTGRGMGTPSYMAPEQARGQWDTVDERTDVFSLGAILCQILTGQPPYSKRDSDDVLKQAGRGDVAAARERLQQCGADAALVALCGECLSPEREGRPRDAETVAQRVAAYQAEVQARLRRAELERAEAQVRTREERKRRHWRWTAALVLVTGIVASTWLAVWAIREGNQKERNLELAQDRLGQVQKGTALLASIFHDLDPDAEERGAPSLREQLSERLQQAASQLREETIADPLTVARLQNSLGSSLVSLSRTRQAIELLSQARPILEAHLGSDHPETLATANELAAAYEQDGQPDKAVPLYEQTLQKRKAALGPSHADTLQSMNNLAGAYLDAGRLKEAVALYEETLEKERAQREPDHPDVLDSMSNLATAYQHAGWTDKAVPLYEQALEKMKAQRGHEHPRTLSVMTNLAQAYQGLRQWKKAQTLLEQTLDKQREKLGPNHRLTLAAMNNLALAYRNGRQLAKAVPLYEQTLAKARDNLSADHPFALLVANNLAQAYEGSGQLKKAIPLYEEVWAKQKKKIGEDHPTTLSTLTNLAMAYQDCGRLDKAVPLLEKALAYRKAKIRPNHPDTLITMVFLAGAYRASEHLDKALRMYEQALEGMKTTNHPDLLACMNNLALAYQHAGQPKKALPLAEQVLEGCKGKLGIQNFQTTLATWNLARTYQDAGYFDRGENLLRELLARQRKKEGPEANRLDDTLGLLGFNLLKQQKFTEAEPVLRECLTIRTKEIPNDWLTFHTQSMLGDALLSQKKYSEAEPLLLQGYKNMKEREAKIPATEKEHLTEARKRLVHLYQEQGKKDEADKWQKR